MTDAPTPGTVVLHRPARRWPRPVPTDELIVQPPPAAAAGEGMSLWMQLLFPLVTGLGSVTFVLLNPSGIFIAIAVVVVLASIGLGFGMYWQQRSGARRRAQREAERYLTYLEELAERAETTARLQDEADHFVHPGPVGLWAVVCDRTRVWERRPEDPDFASTRLGLGDVPLATPMRLAEDAGPLTDRDAALVAACRRLIDGWSTVPAQPISVDLRSRPSISLIGPRPATRAIARAMVMELATFCAARDLRLVVCRPAEAGEHWELVKWLPHARGGDGRMLIGDQEVLRRIADDLERRRDDARRRSGAAAEGAAAEEPQAHLLVVLDGFAADSPLARLDVVAELAQHGRELGTSTVFLVETQRDEPTAVDVRVHVRPDGTFDATDASGGSRSGLADPMDTTMAEAIARRLAGLRLDERDRRQTLAQTCRLADLIDLDRPETGRGARPRSERELLRAPLGISAQGEPVVLDLKEPALGGIGPHGLVVGATGSGKSELLRTLTVGLVATHPPEQLSLVLVDFKGGATFAGMADLPHVAGMITNLQADLALVDRMRDALYGEQLRRQELLRRAGNLDSIRDYQRRFAERAGLEPLPYLLVIVDEFGELLTSRPDFIDLFVAIGRVGRSLGMHLLLATQRLDEGRLRGLESHLSYRIALRVFSATESRAVIGSVDAYTLPPVPGSAYLKVDAAAPLRFRVASVSTPHAPPPPPPVRTRIEAFSAEAGPPSGAGAEPSGHRGPTTVQVMVDRLRQGATSRVHQVWLPPLEPVLTLDHLLGPITEDGRRGLTASEWPGRGRLLVPIGMVDRPTEQAKDVLTLDFAGGMGHLAVVGAPQTGKSTLLRTLVCALALTHTPAEVQCYAIDFGGGGLQVLQELPHVGTVCGRFDHERSRRVVSELRTLLDHRERLFREAGVDSAQGLRALRATGGLPDEAYGDVFLVIDNWAGVRQEFEDLEPVILDLAARGLGYGVHLVVTANRWMDIRSNLRDNISGRLELRLNDPNDSEVERRLAASVPAGVPGRGLTPDRRFFQAALPRIDGRAVLEGQQAALEDLVRRAARAWTGPGAPPARVLPRRLLFTDLPAPGEDLEAGVPIGVGEPDLAPVYLDLESGDPHFLVFGDGESGKTTLLRTYLAGLAARSTRDRVAIVVIDYRRGLLEAVPQSLLHAYAPAAAAAMEAVNQVARTLAARMPGGDLSAADLRRRAWWTGPELLVVVDDLDLVVTPSSNPLLPLLDLLAQGHDLGFHLLAARRAAGTARAMFEPVLQRLVDLGTPGLLLSGDRHEGPLLGGQAPTAQPPGRGILVRRHHPPRLVQIAWSPG
ncbi:MAG TPA: type VII secretion protein EccCb [Candidatus Dormibacteraeota bacterium]|nr:type VII secretion protein EccCb [Candidatus Dormibacteraeota bacterium]